MQFSVVLGHFSSHFPGVFSSDSDIKGAWLESNEFYASPRRSHVPNLNLIDHIVLEKICRN